MSGRFTLTPDVEVLFPQKRVPAVRTAQERDKVKRRLRRGRSGTSIKQMRMVRHELVQFDRFAAAQSHLFPLVIPALLVTVGIHGAVLQTSSVARDSVPATEASGIDSFALLERLAKEQVATDTAFLGKTRFTMDPHDGTFFYDLRPVSPRAALSEKDPDGTPLEALIRVESLRRDFRLSLPAEDFWSAPLDSAVVAVRECVQMIGASQSKEEPEVIRSKCSSRIEPHFDALSKAILAYAAGHHLKFVQPDLVRSPATGFKIQVKTDPPGGHIKVMTLLEYKKYQYSKTPAERYQWNELLDAEIEMIGWYHYRAEWGSKVNSADEGDFDVKAPGTLTFTPRNQ